MTASRGCHRLQSFCRNPTDPLAPTAMPAVIVEALEACRRFGWSDSAGRLAHAYVTEKASSAESYAASIVEAAARQAAAV